MPERDIPPPSETLEYYRAEVGRRADGLGRRHRRRVVGATAAVLVLALVALATTVRITAPTGHVSASGASRARAPHTGSDSLRHQPAGSVAAGVGTPPAPEGSSNSPKSATSAAGAVAPQYSAGGRPGQVTVYEKPSGTVVSAGVNQNVLVVLAPTSGGWGRVVIGRGRHTVLTLVSQAEVARGGQLTFRTQAVGTAMVAVAPTGKPTAPWRLTVVVKDT